MRHRLRLRRRDFLAAGASLVGVAVVAGHGSSAVAATDAVWGVVQSVRLPNRITLATLSGTRELAFSDADPNTYNRDGVRSIEAFKTGDQAVAIIDSNSRETRIETCYVHSGGQITSIDGQHIETSDGSISRLTADTIVTRDRRTGKRLSATTVPAGLQADVTSLIDGQSGERIARLIVLSA